MKINGRSIGDYRRAVDVQAELARAYVNKSLDAYFAANPGATTADGREFAIDLLKAALPNFTDSAGTLAADFFDEVMDALGIDAQAQLYEAIDYDTVEEKVRYFAGKLNGGDEDAFKKQVADATRYFVKRSAYENMVRNCEGNKVRYARVPSGFETCAFCFMLASRGFVYHSEATARGEHGYHPNCSCTIVPGSRDKNGNSRVRIDGYDPETMARNWSACERTIGGREQARKEWLALPEEERAGLVEKHGSHAKAFAHFERNRIMREVATRDWHWLYTGEAPDFNVLEGATPSDDEKETARRAARFGYKSEFRPTADDRRSDVFFVSGETRTAWEYKHPTGNGRWTVNHQFEEAAGQCTRLLLDITDLEKPETGDRWNRESIEKKPLNSFLCRFAYLKGAIGVRSGFSMKCCSYQETESTVGK